jgi:hypothetical protein
VAKIADILQQVLSCVHGGKVFVEHAAFAHGGSYESCKGVKSLAPFSGLRHTGREYYSRAVHRLMPKQSSFRLSALKARSCIFPAGICLAV